LRWYGGVETLVSDGAVYEVEYAPGTPSIVTAPAAIKRKILCALDVAINPKLGVAKAMHFFYSARIFPAEFFPRRIHFELAL
jgi:hypothetical protein